MQTKFSFQKKRRSFPIASLARFANLAPEHAYVIIFFLLKEKEQLQNLVDPLTFDLTYDLINPSSCTGGLCPILNDYNDIGQRTVRAEVSTSYEKPALLFSMFCCFLSRFFNSFNFWVFFY